MSDAILAAVECNATHGKRRTNADKRRAVTRLLEDEEWGQWSNNAIAKKCGVSLDLVNRMRLPPLNDSLSERTYTNKHGQTATMNTANIGKASARSRGSELVEDPAGNDTDQAQSRPRTRD